MAGNSAHGKLVNEALAHWGAGRLAEALDCYTAAIEACPPSHWALWDYYGGRAGVLAALGRHHEAGREYERLLEFARQEEVGDEHINIALARYFLGHHLLGQGAIDEALSVVTPSIDAGAKPQALLRSVQAMALRGLGRASDAKAVADSALAASTREEERANVRTFLAPLLDDACE